MFVLCSSLLQKGQASIPVENVPHRCRKKETEKWGSKSASESSISEIAVQLQQAQAATATYGEVWLSDWQDAGLLKPSVVKPVIATLEAPLIIRQLGTLTDADTQALRAALDAIIGDAPPG